MRISIFLIALILGAYQEWMAWKVSTPGYFKGTVVDKTVSVGRSSTHYLLVNWDGIGVDSIVVHPVTYKRTDIGDSISAQLSYVPLFGAVGFAYAPHVKEYNIWIALMGIISKIILLWFLMCFLWRIK